MGDRRLQAVHHQLGNTDHALRHGHRGDGERERAQGDLDDHRPQRHAGVHRRGTVRQGRLERLGHPSADVRRRTGACRQPPGRAGERLPQFPQHPRRRTHRDRCSLHGRGGGLPGGGGRVCEEPHDLRCRAQHPPERPVHLGPHACTGAHRPSRLAPRCATPRCGETLRRGRGHREAGRRGGRDGQRQGRDADLRRERLHERVPGGASLPAIRRSSRSARAPPKCNCSSSLVDSDSPGSVAV